MSKSSFKLLRKVYKQTESKNNGATLEVNIN